MAKIGIYDDGLALRGGGGKMTLTLAAHLSRTHDVEIIAQSPADLDALGAHFGADLARVRLVALASGRRPGLPANAPGAAHLLGHILTRRADDRKMRNRRLDLFINCVARDMMPNPARRGIYLCMFPKAPPEEGSGWNQRARWRIKQALEGPILRRLGTYDRVVAISDYTRDWMERLWRCAALVVYPVCEDMGPPAPKERILLHVGRFTLRGHPKRQEILLRAFQQMKDLHQAGWQMHFAGSVEPGEGGQRFLSQLQEAAQGLPVVFHLNASFEALRDLYRRAALLWHATGYGYSAEIHPHRHEHFGITPVEAMSAQVVPIVLNSGGLPETVAHGVTGFRWDTLQEMIDYTRLLAADPDKRRVMGEAAALSAAAFGKDAFLAHMDNLINPLLEADSLEAD